MANVLAERMAEYDPVAAVQWLGNNVSEVENQDSRLGGGGAYGLLSDWSKSESSVDFSKLEGFEK